jgi:hypothetical protein
MKQVKAERLEHVSVHEVFVSVDDFDLANLIVQSLRKRFIHGSTPGLSLCREPNTHFLQTIKYSEEPAMSIQ